MTKTPTTIKIAADAVGAAAIKTALASSVKFADVVRRSAATAADFEQRHQAVCYHDAHQAIARWLMAHGVETIRAYDAATDVLDEHLDPLIEGRA